MKQHIILESFFLEQDEKLMVISVVFFLKAFSALSLGMYYFYKSSCNS